MAQFTLTEAQRILLGIITSVESGVTTPEEAALELSSLKARASTAGVNFKADYTVADFQKIRENYVTTYDTSAPYEEPSYEYSNSY